MAYVSLWQLLSEALTAVIEANRCSKDEAQADICRAIADGAVKIRCKLARHTTRQFTCSNTVLEGKVFDIPTDINREDLDWEKSRPLKPWFLRRENSRVPGYWELGWIELSRTDITNALCLAGKRRETTQQPSQEVGARRRSQPVLERARRAIKELYPDEVPGQADVPNASLCRRVGENLKRDGVPDVSDDTILRAAGRRK